MTTSLLAWFERDLDLAQVAPGVGGHRVDDVAHERAVLDPPGGEAGGLVGAPGDDVGGLLDLLDLVAVDHLLVAGEVDHPRPQGAELLADREQHRVAQAPADQQDGLLARGLGRACRWGPSG